jgi:hypothetical protein
MTLPQNQEPRVGCTRFRITSSDKDQDTYSAVTAVQKLSACVVPSYSVISSSAVRPYTTSAAETTDLKPCDSWKLRKKSASSPNLGPSFSSCSFSRLQTGEKSKLRYRDAVMMCAGERLELQGKGIQLGESSFATNMGPSFSSFSFSRQTDTETAILATVMQQLNGRSSRLHASCGCEPS